MTNSNPNRELGFYAEAVPFSIKTEILRNEEASSLQTKRMLCDIKALPAKKPRGASTGETPEQATGIGMVNNLGTSLFPRMVKNFWYIDKTGFIPAFIGGVQALLITVPKRFGKTSIISMMECFLEIEVNKSGQPLGLENSSNEKFFKNTSVYQNKIFFQNHFGVHPVLKLNFRQLLGFKDYKGFLERYELYLYQLYEKFAYVLPSKMAEQLKRKQLFNSEGVLQKGLEKLCLLIHSHFKEQKEQFKFINPQIYILIDELDAPLLYMLEITTISKDDVENINMFLGIMLGGLVKDNPVVKHSLLFGSHNISGVFCHYANNVVVRSFFEKNKFSVYFGFTEENVKKITSDEAEMKLISEWYNGHLALNEHSTEMKMYCPWSVLNYIDSGNLKKYWSDGGVTFFGDILSTDLVTAKLDQLMNGDEVEIQRLEKYSIKHLINLRNSLHGGEITGQCVELWLQYLLHGGYFSVAQFRDGSRLKIKIPNMEMRKAFLQELYKSKIFPKFVKNNQSFYSAVGNACQEFVLNPDKKLAVKFANALKDLFDTVKVKNHFQKLHHLLQAIESISTNFGAEEHPSRESAKFLDLWAEIEDAIIIIEVNSRPTENSSKALSKIFGKKCYEIVKRANLKMKRNYIFMGVYYLQKNFESELSISFKSFKSIKEINEVFDEESVNTVYAEK